MKLEEVLVARAEDLKARADGNGKSYEYTQKPFASPAEGTGLAASFYELAPGKANYPYHYHLENEELLYIISGRGTLRTPSGEREVSAGDAIVCPPGPNGAHKLTNTSDEPLKYLDVDLVVPTNVCVYPDSGNVGIYSPHLDTILNLKGEAGYYDGEDAEK
ncbi:MAG: cupin domain-containing protein [Clostridiales bacterium]|nr:cupin domain-containing protein [Clostridiales bacterium]